MMQARLWRGVTRALIFPLMLFVAMQAQAAPYAALVMDARNGEVIFARNHDTKLHPASLTKMMTVYIAFEAIKHGEITLDTMFTVSRNATATPCVCLGLRPGQRISVRHLIRAAALRSANDATVVLAEGISGSVEAFAQRMTRTARAMGMDNTTFRNPHGLTQTGHLSTARDMTILGRQLFFDYPQYWGLFSRRSEDAGVAVVPNTNRRFLDAYSGADGIKTGFTRAAGFNLTASAQRGGRHILVTMFGGTSAAQRNAHVAELMDMGFSRAATRVAVRAPRTPAYQGRGTVAVAAAPPATTQNTERPAAARTIRLQTAVQRSLRPQARPVQAAPTEELLLAVRESIEAVVEDLAIPFAVAEAAPASASAQVTLAPVSVASAPPPRPTSLGDTPEQNILEVAEAVGFGVASAQDLAALDEPAAGMADPDVPADLALAEAVGFSLVAPQDLAVLDMPADPAQPTAEPDLQDAPMQVTDLTVGQPASLPEEAPQRQVDDPDLPPLDQIMLAQAELFADETTEEPGFEEELRWVEGPEALLARAGPDPLGNSAPGIGWMANADLDYVGTYDVARAPEPAPVAQIAPSGIVLTSSAQPDASDVIAVASVAEARVAVAPQQDTISRLSTSDDSRTWAVSLGQFSSRSAAERGIITVQMAEAMALENGISRIRQVSGRFEASFAGLTMQEAERACLRLNARAMDCTVAQP